MRLIEAGTDEKGDELTTWETIKVAAPTYIPATLTCLGTLTCIFGANALNRKQQAALISAYVTMDQAYRQYSDKVKKSIGAEAESQIREDIAKENFTGDYISESDDTQLFYDMRHGVFFESTVDIAELDDGLECIIIDSPTLV
jgi:DNA-dependent RNA polymerase auxiliary subunit epsilon